jgi:type IV pilus assembly protein PilX
MTSHLLYPAQRAAPIHAQRGIVLALVLVMLGILSLIGALSMRNATLTEQTSSSLRTAASAQQSAELALKYCELVAASTAEAVPNVAFTTERGQISTNTITTTISAGAWNQTTTWSGTGTATNVISVPGTYLNNQTEAARTDIRVRPQCVIERIKDTVGPGFVVTARGFGNDAVLNATNGVTSGAEAWVQSVLRP